MPGEVDLPTLPRSMRPELQAGTFVFATLAAGRVVPAGLSPFMVFREAEGATLIVGEAEARRVGLAGAFACRMITLRVRSSLEAVGFLAAVTARLAAAGIGVNPVSGYHHDHLFVPADHAAEAMDLLHGLAHAQARERP